MFDKILGNLFGKNQASPTADATDESTTSGGAATPDFNIFSKIGDSLFGAAGTGGVGGLATGLQSMMSQFQASGLGEKFKSWVGSGENLPISKEQISSVFDGAKLKEMATSAGISVDAIKEKLATFLPGLVDKLTPNGQMPPNDHQAG
jgi:uncharacterized protein YidB (DUF937 family)